MITNNKSISHILSMRAVLVANFVLVLVLALAFGRSYTRNLQVQHRIDLMERESQEIQARNFEILKQNSNAASEFFLEKEARVKLGLAKPGESSVVIESEPVAQAKNSTSEFLHTDDQVEERIDNPEMWWAYFFDKASFEKQKL